MSDVQVFGADWCEDTTRTREYLDAHSIRYDYIDVEKDAQAQQWVVRQNDGKQKTPTVKVANQIVLSEPSDAELEIALKKHRLMA
jgi:glutaredoxin